MLRSTIISLFITLISTHVWAQQVTISNNLLYDATLTPNLRVGVRLNRHWSMGLTGGFRPWPTDDETTRKYRHLLLSPDLRYWTDSVDVHHFFGANLIYSHYNVGDIKFPFGMYKSVRDERRQGDLGALGAFYGYSWPLGRYWNIEALIGAAIGYTKFARYPCVHCGDKIGDESKWFAMPQAAINIVYNIPGRPAKTISISEPVVLPKPVTETFVFIPALSRVHVGTTGQIRRDERPLNVHFPFDRSELLPDFRNNAQVLQQIIDITHHIMVDSMIDVKTIQIVGLASIEGTVAHNEQLGRDRAMALQRYVQEQLQLPDSLFGTVGGGEAWDDFRAQLEECVAAEAQQPESTEQLRQALAIIDSEDDLNQRERKLKRMNGGRTWNYIKQHILRDQRNSGYIRVYYQSETDKVAITINHAVELLRTDCSDCHHEALDVLNTVRDDERAQNALGVALWLCGRENEALEHFSRAAANGDTDAINNLRQLEKKNKY